MPYKLICQKLSPFTKKKDLILLHAELQQRSKRKEIF